VLFDEPFASLDRTLRDYLLVEVREWLTREHIAALYVTHDASEACAFADEIVVMKSGQIMAHATPAQLYQHPPSAFVAQLLGMRGVIDYQAGTGAIQTAFGMLPFAPPTSHGHLLIRPEAGIMAHQQLPASMLRGTVVQMLFRPPWQRLTICAQGDPQQTFEVDCAVDLQVTVGDSIEVAIAHAACTFLSQNSSPA
jgi:iron(III) transport system ATP-binding protein